MIEVEITTNPNEAPEDCVILVEIENEDGNTIQQFIDIHENGDLLLEERN